MKLSMRKDLAVSTSKSALMISMNWVMSMVTVSISVFQMAMR